MNATEKRTIARAIASKDFGILEELIAPAPVKAKSTIDGLLVRLGTWIRKFDPESKKAIETAGKTNCRVCVRPLSMGRLVPFHIGSKQSGYAHYACAPWIHPADCLCISCRTRRARAAKPLNFTGLTKMLPPQNMEQLLGQKTAVRVSAFAAKAKLRLCACGHDGSCHAKDELDNLLKCQMQSCPCDHFHYQADEAPTVSAAAGN